MSSEPERMTGEQLQQRLREGRADLDRALAALPRDRWEAPLLDGGWSVKDTLAHLTHWQRDVIDRLSWPADRSRPPLDDAAIERINADAYQRQHDEPLDVVLAAFERTAADFAAAFAALDDVKLNDPRRWAWTGGAPVWRWAAGDGWEHFGEHADNIRRAAGA